MRLQIIIVWFLIKAREKIYLSIEDNPPGKVQFIYILIIVMKISLAILFLSLTSSAFSQKLTLKEFVKLDSMSNMNSRVTFLTSKGFVFFDSATDYTSNNIGEHQTAYSAGIGSNLEIVRWPTSMESDEITYETGNTLFYDNLIRQLRQRFPKGIEKIDSSQNIFLQYSKNSSSVTGEIRKTKQLNGTSIVEYKLIFKLE